MPPWDGKTLRRSGFPPEKTHLQKVITKQEYGEEREADTPDTYPDHTEKIRRTFSLAQTKPGIKSLSELLRNSLDNRKIIVQTYDNSLDALMEQLSTIRTELHRIGANINQITNKFHKEKLPEARLLQALEVQQFYQEIGGKVNELLGVIAKISYRWLPG